MNSWLDRLRLQYPLKLDFCRMTAHELRSMIDTVIAEDRESNQGSIPLVAIGHSKDLYDYDSIDAFLAYLKNENIAVTTFSEFYERGKVAYPLSIPTFTPDVGLTPI